MAKKVVTKESIELKRLRSESKAFSDYTSRMAQHANENVETISRLTATVRDLQNKLSVSEAERNGFIKQLQEREYDDNRVPELERQLKAAQDRAATAFLDASKCDSGLQNKYDAMKECVRILENLIVRLALNGDR